MYCAVTYLCDDRLLCRETQRNRQVVADKLAAYLEQPGINEEELISRAAAEAVAKQDKRQHEKEEQQAVMLRSIAEHREAMVNSFGNMLYN